MSAGAGGEVTVLLDRLAAGDARAAEELLPLLYDELRRLARARLARERPGQTLQATGLVHEAYLRLVGRRDPGWNGRGHFFGAAAEAMRRILIERARRKACARHGGDLRRVTLDDALPGGEEPAAEELLAVDAALTRLEARSRVLAEVVKLRYVVGLTVKEIAEVTGRSRRSVDRDWAEAKRRLHEELTGMAGGDDGAASPAAEGRAG